MPSTLVSPEMKATAVASTAELKRTPRKLCFSLAAYSKAILEHLRAAGTQIADGLSDAELSALESDLTTDLPPDLRAILSDGVPIGPGFPDWRRRRCRSHLLLHVFPAHAPLLVRIYRNFYMPATAGAGNPVFHVHRGVVRLAGDDLADFFQKEGFIDGDGAMLAATWTAVGSPRKVEFWSDAATDDGSNRSEIEGVLEEAEWALRDGGWGEDDIREMIGGGNEGGMADRTAMVETGKRKLREAGWRDEDVVECMGCAVARAVHEDKEDGAGKRDRGAVA